MAVPDNMSSCGAQRSLSRANAVGRRLVVAHDVAEEPMHLEDE
jgi:hypothetical protein